ncbi:nitrite reductase small subunit NirD [Pseudonocardia sp. C8]|nr:nitrite reductase small subunit NirD [Pseudonocardia sp. C8]MBC3190245.1 nitrite reductase small subunit NirD [Pseudonocardia sp. C8]
MAGAPTTPAAAGEDPAGWLTVCPVEALLPGRGAAALVGDVQVALFRLADGALHAVGNIDPFTGAGVISRGLVGDRAGEPTVASPIHKQVFALRDGRCLDDDGVSLPAFAVRAVGGNVQVGLR